MTGSSYPSPVLSPDRVVLPRRENTEEPDDLMEITSDAILAMSDVELAGLLLQLGIANVDVGNRDKLIGVIMKIALSARDAAPSGS